MVVKRIEAVKRNFFNSTGCTIENVEVREKVIINYTD